MTQEGRLLLSFRMPSTLLRIALGAVKNKLWNINDIVDYNLISSSSHNLMKISLGRFRTECEGFWLASI